MILGSLPSESVGDTRKATSYLVEGGPKGRFIRSGAASARGGLNKQTKEDC